MSRRNPQKYLDVSDLQDDLGRRTLRGGLWSTVGQAVKSVVELASFPLLARLLTPDDFGLVGMAVAVTGFLHMFKDMGLTLATVQREDITHEQVNALFWINAGLGFLVAIIAALSAWVLAWFYNQPELIGITLALAVAFGFNGLTVQHEALLKRRMLFGRLIIIEAVALVLAVGTAAALALLGWGYWALVAQSLVLAFVTFVGVWLAMGWRPSVPKKAKGLKELLSFGANLTGFNFVNYFARNLDDVLIGRFNGATQLGYYQQAYKIFKVPLTQVNAPVSKVAIPALSRLTGQPQRYREAYCGVLEKLLMITLPLGAFLVGAHDWIILVILGPQWGAAAPIFAMLSIAIFSQAVTNTTGWLLISQNRTGEMFRLGILGTVMTIISFVIGLPWGALGVALSYSLIGVFIQTPIILWLVAIRGPIQNSDFYRSAWPAGLAALGSGTGLLLLRLWTPIESAFANGIIAIFVTIIGALIVSIAFPRGRKILTESIALIHLLRSKEGADLGGAASAGEDGSPD